MSSQQLRITLAGREHVTEAGTTAGAALDGGPGVIAARVNGVPRDLAHVLADGDEVEPIVNSSDEGHAILRHSTAHVLAQAVQDLDFQNVILRNRSEPDRLRQLNTFLAQYVPRMKEATKMKKLAPLNGFGHKPAGM